MHLMWWWQPFLIYFEFSSLSRVQGAYFNHLNIHLVWVCRVRGEVPPRTFFPLSPNDEACKVDHLSHVSLLGLVSVLRQDSRLNTLFLGHSPHKSGVKIFYYDLLTITLRVSVNMSLLLINNMFLLLTFSSTLHFTHALYDFISDFLLNF